jgi:hypothetical protein
MSVKHWWWTVFIVGGALSGGAWGSQEPGPHWLSVNGTQWRRMDPDVRLAYVEGFLAGAALGQAASRARDTAAVRTGLEALKRSGGLRFPFSANVYESRVNDFYWWENHLPLPTWYAFLEVNATLGRLLSDSVP